jgi:hypothetical protein
MWQSVAGSSSSMRRGVVDSSCSAARGERPYDAVAAFPWAQSIPRLVSMRDPQPHQKLGLSRRGSQPRQAAAITRSHGCQSDGERLG